MMWCSRLPSAGRRLGILVPLALPLLAGCTVPWAHPPGPSSVSAPITAETGGVVTHPNGAQLRIPPHALAADATVTLTDTGPRVQIGDDPLQPASDAFVVMAKGANGQQVQLTAPASLTITPGAGATQRALDLLMAESDPETPAITRLHYAPAPSGGKAILLNRAVTSSYRTLNSTMYVVALDQPPAPQPYEKEVLQIPWYDQDGAQWCPETSLTSMMRYYDFTPDTGDSLTATFGGDTALANWQIAAQSHLSKAHSAGYDILGNIGVTLENNGATPQPGDAPQVHQYLWDDNFVLGSDISGYVNTKGAFNDFVNYVTLVNVGYFGLGDRKPLAIMVDARFHSVDVVGVDGNGVYISDSSGVIAPKLIAQYITWADFQQHIGQVWKTDDQGNQVQTHTLWTAVAYGYPIKPENARRGSIALTPGDLRSTDGAGGTVSLEWDGSGAHIHGYYMHDPTLNTLLSSPDEADLGYYLLRPLPLAYTYVIANVTNTALTYKSVAELSGGKYGDGLVSQTHLTTVQPYARATVQGSFPAEPSGSQAIFDVKLYETSNPQLVQDVKFVRFLVHDPMQPTATITTPADNAHVYTGAPVVLSGSGHDLNTGETLSGSSLHWAVNASPVGTGANLTHVFTTAGTYTITLTATEQAGQSGSASVTLHVDPAPPQPVVSIVSPADGSSYIVGNTASTYPVTLVAAGSPGMQFSWSDSLDGALGTGSTITWNFSLTQNYNCAAWTTHVITLTGTDTLSRTATATISIILKPSCIT